MTVPAFVQQHSDQKCLLGMNAIPLQLKHSDGEPILVLDMKKLSYT